MLRERHTLVLLLWAATAAGPPPPQPSGPVRSCWAEAWPWRSTHQRVHDVLHHVVEAGAEAATCRAGAAGRVRQHCPPLRALHQTLPGVAALQCYERVAAGQRAAL